MRKYIQDAVEAAAPLFHLDANETAAFSRELERIETQTYDVQYPDLKGRSLVSMGSGLGPADEYNTWRQFDRSGSAVEGDMMSDDIPEVEIKGAETTSKVVSMFIGYSYTVQELRAAVKLGRPIDAMKAFAARDLIERKIEVMVAQGSDNRTLNSVYGLLNQPNVGYTCAATDTGGARVLALRQAAAGASALQNSWVAGGKTPKEIIHDITDAFNYLVTSSNQVHQPNTLVMPLAPYQYMATTLVNDADTTIYSEATILDYVRKVCPWLTSIEPWIQCSLTKQGTKGTALSRAFMYEKKPQNFSLFVPQEFEQFAPQVKNFKFSIPCHARCAGVVGRYPKSGLYIDGTEA